MAILSLQNVSRSFGALKVTDDVSFDLQPGEALGIIGPNGAGKSTLFNLVTGNIAPDEGRVFLDGRDVTRLPPMDRVRAGIGRSFQIPQPFGNLSVYENLLVAARFGGEVGASAAPDFCMDILSRTGLASVAAKASGGLSLLQRKRLELARALAGEPKLLLLDEIAGGLTPHECEDLVTAIKTIRATGVSVIWIEHVVHALLAVVDRLIVIDFGKKIAEGAPQAIMQSREVKEIYLGIEADA